MLSRLLRLFIGLCLLGAFDAVAAVLYVDLNSTNPVSPFSSWATAATNIQDAVDAASNCDEVLVNDGVYQYGGRPAPGSPLTNRVIVTNAITLQSVNGPSVTVIRGFQVSDITNGPEAIRCAYLAGGAELIGFTLTNGATLNTWYSSSDLNSGRAGGVLCSSRNEMLSNCIITGNSAYGGAGGILSGTVINCTIANNIVQFGSLTSPAGSGGGASSSTLKNCLVIQNFSPNTGGGTYDCSLQNCLVMSNSAFTGGGCGGDGAVGSGSVNNCALIGNTASGPGGGATTCVLNDSLIVSNSSSYYGGGVTFANLTNCTIVNNSITNTGGEGGGAYDSNLKNCVIYYNSAPTGSNYVMVHRGSLNYCCTVPSLPLGIDNITNSPLFLNPAAGDFHLQPNSPCINAGYNGYVTNATDLDGNPRISGGTVDIGAYEFQNPASIISYAWLQQYGLPTDGSADFLDPDHDGLNNWQEWLAGTNPINASSVLQMLSPTTTTNPPGLVVTWQSAPNINYYLQRATNLSAQPAFQPLATNLPGQAGTTSYTDTNVPAPGPYFYRVGVQIP